MPKIIELTVEIEIQRVSCPGVWLCQDGRVSLAVFALGTSYQTCLLPPLFPLMFKDIFYFRKRFRNSCAMNNICCLLKDENIYCELVQWCEECNSGQCLVLAQYLGALNDILFPPNLCSNDGVDLLMRRSKAFPGILSPKIEIATKVRIDEVWSNSCNMPPKEPCACSHSESDGSQRQRQVCHSAQYHRKKCSTGKHQPAGSRSRSRSSGSRSCCSLEVRAPPCQMEYRCPPTAPRPRRSCRPSPRRHNCLNRHYNVYNVEVKDSGWNRNYEDLNHNANKKVDIDSDNDSRSSSDTDKSRYEEKYTTYDDKQKTTIESRFIGEDSADKRERRRWINRPKFTPCVCQICKRYHDLFHNDLDSS